MTLFTPSSAAHSLSEALWALSRPAWVRDVGDTSRLFPFVDALDGSRWLVVDTEYSIRVHPDAELNGIADILQPWIDGGHLPADTNAQLAAFVESKRGQSMVPWDAFPQFFKDLSKNLQSMIDDKLLPLLSTP